MKIKELFCFHIWKQTETIFLRKIRKKDYPYATLSTYSNYEIYAEKQECLKCKKIRYLEKEILEGSSAGATTVLNKSQGRPSGAIPQ